jgi:hypothetical protein
MSEATARLEEARTFRDNYYDLDGAPLERWMDERIADLERAAAIPSAEGSTDAVLALPAKWRESTNRWRSTKRAREAMEFCATELAAALQDRKPAISVSETGARPPSEIALSALRSGVELVEGAFAHVSHGGPTRADAEKWLKEARNALS